MVYRKWNNKTLNFMPMVKKVTWKTNRKKKLAKARTFPCQAICILISLLSKEQKKMCILFSKSHLLLLLTFKQYYHCSTGIDHITYCHIPYVSYKKPYCINRRQRSYTFICFIRTYQELKSTEDLDENWKYHFL